MGRSERDKGARGERDFANTLRSAGVESQRTAALQAAKGSTDPDVKSSIAGVHFEVKRQERVQMEKWCLETEAKCGLDVPVVAWRRNSQPWRVTLPLADYLRQLGVTE